MSKRKQPQLSKSAKNSHKAAHMTWASRSVSGTVAKTRDFLSRRLWAWPIIAVVLLLVIGWGVHGAIERTMESNLESQLETVRDVEVAMMRMWLQAQENNAATVAGDSEVRETVAALVSARAGEDQTDDDPNSIAQRLAKQLGPAMNAHDYDSFFIADRSNLIAATQAESVGMDIPPEFRPIFARV